MSVLGYCNILSVDTPRSQRAITRITNLQATLYRPLWMDFSLQLPFWSAFAFAGSTPVTSSTQSVAAWPFCSSLRLHCVFTIKDRSFETRTAASKLRQSRQVNRGAIFGATASSILFCTLAPFVAIGRSGHRIHRDGSKP